MHKIKPSHSSMYENNVVLPVLINCIKSKNVGIYTDLVLIAM